ncbi:MAG: energy transducer TonB [Pyrinomonadaceae bacterium]
MPTRRFSLSRSLIIALAFTFTLLTFVFSSGAQDSSEPAVVSSIVPSYPPIAAAARAFGVVRVEVEIDETGTVHSARVVSGHPLLQKVSEKAALSWQFAPATGEPKMRRTLLTFDFKPLDEKSCQDKEQATHFITPTQVEIRYPYEPRQPSGSIERLSPDLRETHCPVHGDLLQKDTVEIVYGLLAERAGYDKAQEKQFPYSNLWVGGGCVIMTEIDPCTGKEVQTSPQRAAVLYCPKCRIAEKRWLAQHPRKRH